MKNVLKEALCVLDLIHASSSKEQKLIRLMLKI